MPQEPLVIEDLPGPKDGERVLRLAGPLTISNLFEFQAKVRADQSRGLLVGVNQRVRDALQVMRVQQFFTFLDSMAAADKASA